MQYRVVAIKTPRLPNGSVSENGSRSTAPKLYFFLFCAIVVFTRIPGQGSVLYPRELGPNAVIDAHPHDVDAPG